VTEELGHTRTPQSVGCGCLGLADEQATEIGHVIEHAYLRACSSQNCVCPTCWATKPLKRRADTVKTPSCYRCLPHIDTIEPLLGQLYIILIRNEAAESKIPIVDVRHPAMWPGTFWAGEEL